MNQRNNKFKIYTFTVPPNQEEPYLNSLGHCDIINAFKKGEKACFNINWLGEIDFYFLLFSEESIENLLGAQEHCDMKLSKNGCLDLKFSYYGNKDMVYSLNFNVAKPMEFYILSRLIENKQVNIYFIYSFEGEYVCGGYKVSSLSQTLLYNVERYLKRERQLLLPKFHKNSINDDNITERQLLQKAWGFYLDYTAILKRIGNVEESEEVVSRHILDAVARIQNSKCSEIVNDFIIVWIGRKVVLELDDVPIECYSIYLSGDLINGVEHDSVKKIMQDVLKEIPEFRQTLWVSPLKEEGVPLLAISGGKACRLNLDDKFYCVCNVLFQKNYLPHEKYVSFYNKILKHKRSAGSESNVYSLVKKRKEKGEISKRELTSNEITNLVKWGTEEDIPIIISNIEQLEESSLDEYIYVLSKRYKKKMEPWFISLLHNSSNNLWEAGIIGLGLIESTSSIPLLIVELKKSVKKATVVCDALQMIGEPALPYLIPMLKDRLAKVRFRAVKALGTIGSDKAMIILKEMDTDKSIVVERARGSFLRKWGK